MAPLKLSNYFPTLEHLFRKSPIGSTNNLQRRLAEHNSGEVDSTKSRKPFGLEAYIAVKDQAKAIELEHYLKTGSGRALLQKRIL